MNFTELARVIPAYLDSGVSLELVSSPGRGKSDFVEQTYRRMSARDEKQGLKPWGFATLFLATQTPPDLLGYMFKGERTYDGRTVAITDPTLPYWMLTEEGKPAWSYDRGILFLDEFGQAEADVKKAAAELLLHKKVGNWRLGAGWSVISASNKLSDRSAVTKSLDFVINRRLEIPITDDLQSWEDWAFGAGIDPLFISFANRNPQIVFSEGVPDKQGPWCTPRSLVMLYRLFDKMRGEDNRVPTDKLAVETASGMIGQAAAAQLMAHVKLGHEMPDVEDIIKAPTKVKVPSKPDACILVTYNLAARITEKNADPVITYMERMPKEFGVTFAKAACKRMPELVYQPPFERWAEKNASLMTALVDTK